MWPESSAFGTLVILVTGWVWGSFLNQAVDRAAPRPSPGTPPETPIALPRLPDGTAITLFHPIRSHCLMCGTALPWHHNLPVFAWLWLGGRCRRCRAPIGARTLVLELSCPAGFAALHLLARAMDWPGLWEAAALALWSALLVMAPSLVERRRMSPVAWLSGAAALVLWVYGL